VRWREKEERFLAFFGSLDMWEREVNRLGGFKGEEVSKFMQEVQGGLCP